MKERTDESTDRHGEQLLRGRVENRVGVEQDEEEDGLLAHDSEVSENDLVCKSAYLSRVILLADKVLFV